MKRLTFAVTKEMEPLLERAKKSLFYDKNRSEMIRALVMAGLSVTLEKAEKEDEKAVRDSQA